MAWDMAWDLLVAWFDGIYRVLGGVIWRLFVLAAQGIERLGRWVDPSGPPSELATLSFALGPQDPPWLPGQDYSISIGEGQAARSYRLRCIAYETSGHQVMLAGPAEQVQAIGRALATWRGLSIGDVPPAEPGDGAG